MLRRKVTIVNLVFQPSGTPLHNNDLFTFMQMVFRYSGVTIDQTGVEERVARFMTRSVKKDSKVRALKFALSMIDLTTLEGKDTPGKVTQVCMKARNLCAALDDMPTVAAVCVYPTHVATAKKSLEGSGIRVASVATGFPSGNTSTAIKLEETRRAVGEGADEVDMVISRGHFLTGDYGFVADEIAAVREACGGALLKVILETGELSSLDDVRKASELAIYGGADFIKTSTGKVQPAATMPVTLVMLLAIRDHYERTGKKIGMKPAGGISTARQAIGYLVMVHETLGADWMNKQLFRFGASSLANDLVLQLCREEAGTYYSRDYISND
jgi:deoxyribose-phosphate aldolase